MKTMEVQKSAEPTAECGMASAKAEIGVYYASYYPTLTLGAELGQQSSKFSTLFNASSQLWSIGPSISRNSLRRGIPPRDDQPIHPDLQTRFQVMRMGKFTWTK